MSQFNARVLVAGSATGQALHLEADLSFWGAIDPLTGCVIDRRHPQFGLAIDGKVLLIKHKKLGIWLCPGGHLESGELLHQAAEREFWEETGIKVKAKPFGLMDNTQADDNTQIPSPFSKRKWHSLSFRG